MKRVVISLIFGVAVLATATLILQIQRTPHLSDVKLAYHSSDRAILDRNGLVIDEIRVEKRIRRLNWVSLDQIPSPVAEAILKAEDKRFYYHPGFDPLALAKALVARLRGRSDRGASTITMQLTDLIDSPLNGHLKPHHRNLRQKLVQIWKSVVLEVAWSKHDILEAYINLISYRGELQGVAAASFGLFDKSPSALTRPEAAVIAALIRSPNANSQKVRERACWLLANMGATEECGLLTAEHLEYVEQGYNIRPYMRMAPHVAKRLAAMPDLSNKGNLIRSTLDRQIQWVALNALQRQIGVMQSQNMSDGGVLVIENATGNVLAYVGNVGANSKAGYVDAVSAPRQAGSTLKPWIYAKAIDEKILTAATVLEDSPLAISVTTGLYRPANFDRAFRDMVTVRTALASSLNIPAVRALELLTVDTFVATMSDLGFTGLERPDFYGPSLALGSADIRLLELTNAYRALANGGVWSPLRYSPDQMSDQAPKRVVSQAAAFIVTNVLADRQARVATFGLESMLNTPYWTAVKTGTSKDMRDNWCVGYSEKYTVGVWAGNFSGASMWNVSGVQGAAPVWQEVMNYLHHQESSHAPLAPEGLVQKKVTFTHNKEVRDEWFIVGTEPSFAQIDAKPEVRTHITYPLDQSLIAMDPDIPRENHRLFIQVVAPRDDQNLYLNGQRLGRAHTFQPWEPRTGKYTLELRDSKGQTVDTVHFEVRGRSFASAF